MQRKTYIKLCLRLKVDNVKSSKGYIYMKKIAFNTLRRVGTMAFPGLLSTTLVIVAAPLEAFVSCCSLSSPPGDDDEDRSPDPRLPNIISSEDEDLTRGNGTEGNPSGREEGPEEAEDDNGRC